MCGIAHQYNNATFKQNVQKSKCQLDILTQFRLKLIDDHSFSHNYHYIIIRYL